MWRIEDLDSAGNLLMLRIQVHHSGDHTLLRDHALHRVSRSASLVHKWQGYNTMIQQFR